MFMTAKGKTSNLAQRVLNRQKFLERVIKFVEGITVKRGKRTYHQVESYHTVNTWELYNFGGFSFYIHGSFSMMGGDEIKVWYHPGQKRPQAGKPTLHIRYWDIAKLEVEEIDQSLKWQTAIRKLMREADKVAAQIDRQKKKEEAVAKKQAEIRQKENNAEEEAKRLRLI